MGRSDEETFHPWEFPTVEVTVTVRVVLVAGTQRGDAAKAAERAGRATLASLVTEPCVVASMKPTVEVDPVDGTT